MYNLQSQILARDVQNPSQNPPTSQPLKEERRHRRVSGLYQGLAPYFLPHLELPTSRAHKGVGKVGSWFGLSCLRGTAASLKRCGRARPIDRVASGVQWEVEWKEGIMSSEISTMMRLGDSECWFRLGNATMAVGDHSK